MAGYRYGGADFVEPKPRITPKPRKPRSVVACGTTSGYDRHVRNKEASCEECRAAVRAYRKDLRARTQKSPEVVKLPTKPKVKRCRGKTAACGTNSGYEAHTRYQDGICQPCRDAHNAYMRAYKTKWRAARKAA